MIAAFVAFWIALLSWFWLSVLGIGPDTPCANWGAGYALCMMRVAVGVHGLHQTLVSWVLTLLPILLIAFTVIIFLARGRKARTHLLLAFPVTIGMIALCITCGVWLNTIWPLLPQISQFYSQTPAGLLAGLLGMGLATVLALGSLVRAAFALRALSAVAPKQESYAFSSYREESEPAQGIDMPHLEHPTASAGGNGGSSVSKGWRVLLVALLLLFLIPWPTLISSDGPFLRFLALLFTCVTWCMAGVVGFIVALLVKSPGKQRAQRATEKARRRISPLLWAALLPVPFLISTLQVARYTLFDVSLPLPVRLGYLLVHLLPAGLVSGMTVLIVNIRCHRPRLGTALKVWGIFILVFVYAFMFTQFIPISGTLDGLYVAIATSIIPALIVRIHNTNKQADSTAQQPGIEVSPKVWIIILPVVFLVFCAQFEFIVLPDYNDFGDIFVFWCMAGLASLIILLALKPGSRESTDLPTQETLHQVQVQG